jgi:hypothetical protein
VCVCGGPSLFWGTRKPTNGGRVRGRGEKPARRGNEKIFAPARRGEMSLKRDGGYCDQPHKDDPPGLTEPNVLCPTIQSDLPPYNGSRYINKI